MRSTFNSEVKMKISTQVVFRLAPVGAAVLAAACGGGGGGGNAPPAPLPAVDLSITPTLVSSGMEPGSMGARALVNAQGVQVRFVVANAGPSAANGSVIRIDSVPGFTATGVSCADASGGASCPANLTVQAAAGGVTLDLASGASLAMTVTGTVTQVGSVQPRATVVAPSSVSDSNTGNNAGILPIAVEAPAAGSLVTSVPAPTYTAELRAGFDYLNEARGRCGFGLLRQDSRLDAALAGHVNYLGLNFEWLNFQLTWDQVPGRPGFTGATELDRFAAAGYSSTTSASTLAFGLPTTPDSQQIRALVQTIYHGRALLADANVVGIAAAASTPQGFRIAHVAAGSPSGESPQQPAGDAVLLMPCDGDTSRRTVHPPENPDPMPGMQVGTYAPPLYARVRSGQILTIEEWTVRPVGGQPLPTVLRTKANDPNRGLAGNEAALIPTQPLATSTTYQVSLKGRNAGIPFERSYSFTTWAGAL
jgi:hypothetical protein